MVLTRWRDAVLIFIAAVTIGNGAVEALDYRKLNTVTRQQAEITQQLQRQDQVTQQQANRELVASTESQVGEIREFMARNRNEITTVDHYNKQLTSHAQTAIDIANEAVSKTTTEDALTKAIKRKIELLESLLGPESERRKKRTFEEVDEIAKNTLELFKLCRNLSALWATKTRPFDDGDELEPLVAQPQPEMSTQ